MDADARPVRRAAAGRAMPVGEASLVEIAPDIGIDPSGYSDIVRRVIDASKAGLAAQAAITLRHFRRRMGKLDRDVGAVAAGDDRFAARLAHAARFRST